MAAEAKKFLFDRVFSEDTKEIPFSQVRAEEERAYEESLHAAEAAAEAPAEPEEPEEPELPPPPTFSEEELAAARDEAFAKGKAAGLEEAKAASEAAIAKAVESAAAQMESLRIDSTAARNAATAEAVAIAGAITRKLLPSADPEIASREILAVVEEAMDRIYEEPTVVVRINDALAQAIADPIREIAARAGYPGALTVSSDPALAVGDCRIEWGIGGVERDLGALWAEVEEIIQRNTGIDIADMPAPPPAPPRAEVPAEEPTAVPVADSSAPSVTEPVGETREYPADESADDPAGAPLDIDGVDQALAALDGGDDTDGTELDKPLGGDHG